MEISLNQKTWELKGFWPWVPLKETSMETGQKLHGVTDWIPATVPGGVHYDLYRAGWIEYPYKELNSLKCEWVENRWWIYRTYFDIPDITSESLELVFKGLDYQAVIYLNGEELGEHQGMYHPAKFDITSKIKDDDKQELLVLFKGIPDEMGQIGKTSEVNTQKARFNYKWDFSTHMVNIGIWDDVLLKIHKSHSLEDIKLYSDIINGKGSLDIALGIRDNHILGKEDSPKLLRIELELYNPEGKLQAVKDMNLPLDNHGYIAAERCLKEDYLNNTHKINFEIDNPQLWYPNEYGEQLLYQVKINLFADNDLLDSMVFDTGIRSLSYMQNDKSPENALPYTIVINGEKIYVKGVNITPLDHLYGNVTSGHYEYMVRMMKKANINLVRVWGGGLIEKEVFYELCDRYGILVWQDFIQSSSGIDNIPSKRPEFMKLLEKTAINALKERRNHVSLTIWCGGNELMSKPNKPCTNQDSNINLLENLVEEFDPKRLFLPTSASGPVEFVTKEKGVSHDIHGHWHYLGNPEHYDMYGQSDSLFHSEFGVDGVSSVKTLNKILSKEDHYPTPMSGNVAWRHHGEWWGTFFRDEEMFGEIRELEDFVKCSQWIQAEGLRYILEANRRRKFENSGSIIWQLNEPWPNASCTNLIEYYGDPKMAYYWTKGAYSPLDISLGYSKLNYAVGGQFNGEIYSVTNQYSGPLVIKVEVLDSTGNILYQVNYDKIVRKDISNKVSNLNFAIDESFEDLFFVRLKLGIKNDLFDSKVYIFSTEKDKVYKPALEMDKAKLNIKAVNKWQNFKAGYNFKVVKRNYLIENSSNIAALHIHPLEVSNAYYLSADKAYFTLFPGEKKKICVECIKKQGGGFLKDDQADMIKPILSFHWFNQ